MNCKQCNKEIIQIEGKKERVFCNDACRMAHNRQIKSEQIKSEQLEIKSEQPKANKMSAKEIYDAIDNYPQNTWRESLEYAELMRRLGTWTKEKLQETGHWIPNRLNGVKIRK